MSPLVPDTLRSGSSCFQGDGQRRCPLKPRALDQDAFFHAPGPARPPAWDCGGRLSGPSWEETLLSSRAYESESGVSTLSPSIRCICLPGGEEDREPRPQLSHPQLGGRWEGARWGGPAPSPRQPCRDPHLTAGQMGWRCRDVIPSAQEERAEGNRPMPSACGPQLCGWRGKLQGDTQPPSDFCPGLGRTPAK